MSPKDGKYSEDALVERLAIELFDKLKWSVQNCFNEFDENGKSSLGRETKADVVIVSKLKPVLRELNADVSETAIDEAIKILTADRSVMSMVAANREIYELLKSGIPVFYLNDKHEQVSERVKVIDWVNIDNNDFFLASQFWITGEMYTRRADLIGFVNGIPLLFIELKASHNEFRRIPGANSGIPGAQYLIILKY